MVRYATKILNMNSFQPYVNLQITLCEVVKMYTLLHLT